jgi:hypothetical protein
MNLRETEIGGKFDGQPSNELPNSLRTLNLFKLSSSENDELRRQIENQKGHVDILVHPYYPCYSDFFNNSVSIYHQQREKFMKDLLAGKKPLILFEERSELNLRKLSLPRDFKNGKIHMVTTYQNTPTPVLPKREILALRENEVITDAASWNYLKNVLVRIGVKHIGIGGRQLVVTEGDWDGGWEQKINAEKQPNVSEWLKGNKIPLGCVGFAAIELAKRGFDVSFSSITSPSKWGKTSSF